MTDSVNDIVRRANRRHQQATWVVTITRHPGKQEDRARIRFSRGVRPTATGLPINANWLTARADGCYPS